MSDRYVYCCNECSNSFVHRPCPDHQRLQADKEPEIISGLTGDRDDGTY